MMMTRFARIDVINTIYERGVVPSFAANDLNAARSIVKACADGGARAIQWHIQNAADAELLGALVAELAADDPAIILGAGAVADAQTVDALLNAGAGFIIGASADSAIARQCHRRKVNYIPVCCSLSEIEIAEEMGVETVRIHAFEPALTPAFLKTLLQDRPWTRIMKAGDIQPGAEPVANWVQAGAACIGVDVQAMAEMGSLESLPGKISDIIWYVKKARGENLFCGVEHLGIYPEAGQDAAELTGWYKDIFGFDIDEGESWYFVHSTGPGRIEILKDHEPTKAHVAIKVRHFDLACRRLADKGLEFEPVKDFGRVKAVFLKQRDPAGHKVHLLYQALL
jgi:2-dehydro-3-deoxyphosphogluconate aldolase/(4S)-4-hydroxy-2-oxoglutarate aldolase